MNNSASPKSKLSQRLSNFVQHLQQNPAYLIIAVLAAVIIIGGLYIVFSERGETVEIVSFTPSDEVPQTTNFTIEFSRNLVSDSLLNMQIDQAAVEFSPDIPGKFRWIALNKLRFFPDVLLAPSTQYTAEISPGIASGHGYTLSGKWKFKFHTPRLRVNSAILTTEFQPDAPGKMKLLATIEFNYDADPRTAIKYIFIQNEQGQSIPFNLMTSSPSTILTLQSTEHIERGEEDKEMKLVVSEDLPCVGCGLGLEREYVKPLILPGQQDLVVERMLPRKIAPSKGYVQIQFNLPIDPEQAQPFINVEPSLDYKLMAAHRYLELRGEFKMDTTYQVTVRKGLKAVDGSELKKEVSNAVTFRKEQIPPQVTFVGDGFYLTKSGNLNVGLSTINISKVTLEVDKIFANNLTYLLNVTDLSQSWSGWYQEQALGKNIYTSDMVVQEVENEEVITPINVREYVGDQRRGIFKLTARLTNQRWNQTTKWVVATDLGMLAKKGGNDLWVWVNSLTTLTPVQNAELKLISQNNQTLLTAKTNSDGVAIFNNYSRYEDEFDPYLITASYGEDLTFLELARRRISTSDFDVDGKPYLQHGYEAFLYNERGVYRPGETAHLAAIVRGKNARVPQPFPVNFQVKGPDKKILIEQRATLNEQGSAGFAVNIPDYVLTGKYVAALLIGEKEEIGRTAFNVEEFVPDRMKVKLSTDKESYVAGEKMQINVDAVTFFGPPAAGRRVQGEVEIEAFSFSPPNYKTFTFANTTKSFDKQTYDLAEQTLDEQGKLSYTFQIPQNFAPPSSLRGVISTTVLEPGGRGVTAYRGVMIHPYPTYVGLRKAKEGYASPNEETKIDFIVLDPEQQPVSERKIEISFYRIYWQSILKRVQSNGRYRYVSEKAEDLVNKFTVTSEQNISSLTVKPLDYGEYRVEAKDVASGGSASLSFYASGWGYSPWAMDHPDRIELDLDKELYSAGESARIQVRAPFPGKLLLTIERNKVLDYKVVTLKENTATLEMPVKVEYKPNVYVSAHLIRSTESLARDTPVRAFGVVPLSVNSAANRLRVELEVPEEVRPQTQLQVKFQIHGQTNAVPYVTIAAVDEGICQLTDFQTPDLHDYFFGKKRLSVESYDIYGVILPEIEPTLSSASGDIEATRKRQLTPVSVTRVKPVAFWSGLMKTDSKGRGQVTFDMPQFNGSVRVMAVAFAGDKFGSQQENVFVRGPIVLTPTFPRFLSSNDQFTVPVNIYNSTGKDNNFKVRLTANEPIRITGTNPQSVQIPAAAEKQVYFDLQAGEDVGEINFHLSVTGGGEKSEMSVDVPLRPPAPFVTLSGSGTVAENSPASVTFPKDWIAGTTKFTLSVSAFPAVKFARSLQYLLQYPHGCIEQTTSRVFPLLYFNDLARLAEPELFNRNSADYYIEEGIAKLESMQLASGAFSYWPTGDYINNWSSVYAAHFLVEARKAGYVVSDRVYDRMLDALKSYTRDYHSDDPNSYQTAVYACYVLALANQPDKSSMLYFKNSALDKLSQYSKFQLAGAFALSGDLQTALSLLPKTVVPIETTDKRQTGYNFNSSIRAQAIMLDILAQINDRHPLVPILVENLTKTASERGYWYNTQENAFAFLALGKISQKQRNANYTGTASINGELNAKFTTDSQMYSGENWAGKTATVQIKGHGTCYYYWDAEGIPAKQYIDEYDRDLQVRRRYLDENGNAIPYTSFKQGDLVIAEISIKPLAEDLDNVAIADLLPAGFEIENPRLQSRKGISWIGKNAYTPMYMDIRDDRMVIYGNFRLGHTAKFYYGLRAVTQGEFVLPPVRGEAMYAPSKASVASSGEVVIQAF